MCVKAESRFSHRAGRLGEGGILYPTARPSAVRALPALAAAVAAGEEPDDDAAEVDDAGDDGLEDAADAGDDGHDRVTDRAEEGGDLMAAC